MFNNKTIRTKLLIVSITLLLLPSLVIGTSAYFSSKKNLDTTGEKTLKNGVEMALQIIDALNQQVEDGSMTLGEAQEQARIYLIGPKEEDGIREIKNTVDLGEHGYFNAFNEKGIDVAHYSDEGDNSWDTKDVNGKPFVQEVIKNAQNGGGFTTYEWKLPNNPEKTGEKIVYSALDPNWGWVVSAGTYKMDFNAGANEVLVIVAATIAIATIIGIAVIIWFTRSLSKPLHLVTQQVDRLAHGDLTVEPLNIKNKDEIGILANDFNIMATNIREIITTVEHSIQQASASAENLSAISEETSASSQEISSAIDEIASGTAQQAKDVEVSNKKMADLSTKIEMVEQLNEKMNVQSQAANKASQAGLAQMTSLQLKSEEANELCHTVVEVMNRLSVRVNEIESVMSVIHTISDQTNLLALNASIEAARAGEHGKGFAVVAEEVRKLAEQSSQATGDVRQTLNGIISESDQALQAIELSQSLNNEQTKAVSDTKQAFELIVDSVKEIVSSINEVDHEVQKIAVHKGEVLASIEHIAAIAQQSSASTEEITASMEEQLRAIATIAGSAEQLNEVGDELKQKISKLQIH
ncbi:methyl-accepting chemotaxis protein [Bacillus sp. FJAT-52991]|uniref:Methyl-accepting chemotaxis protein n=2 Tax=Bacillus kandeliae TaxID=3129297 RepID=A0ABZ2N641_9BACI